MLPQIKLGAFRFREATQQMWELQHEQNSQDLSGYAQGTGEAENGVSFCILKATKLPA